MTVGDRITMERVKARLKSFAELPDVAKLGWKWGVESYGEPRLHRVWFEKPGSNTREFLTWRGTLRETWDALGAVRTGFFLCKDGAEFSGKGV